MYILKKDEAGKRYIVAELPDPVSGSVSTLMDSLATDEHRHWKGLGYQVVREEVFIEGQGGRRTITLRHYPLGRVFAKFSQVWDADLERLPINSVIPF
jgi:hypothetical protein